MADAIGQELAFAVGVGISPVPVMAVALLLATPRGRLNGSAFLCGWLIGLAAVGTLVLVAAAGADASDRGAPATWVSWLKIALGLLLLAVAVRQWRGRPAAGEEPPSPGWMTAMDAFTAGRALVLGLALAALNPKNLLLTVGAAAAIAQTGEPAGTQAVALGLFVVIGSLGAALPMGIATVMGQRGDALLDGLKTWMSTHNVAIMSVLCLVIAAKLVGDGISGLGT